MADEITINGRSLELSDQQPDASSSNYILLRTKGEPLRKDEKAKLRTLNVEIQEFVGDGSQQLYLCKYEPKSLEEIRNLDFIAYADVYNTRFVIPDVLQTKVRNVAESGSGSPIEVDILLHHDIKEASSLVLHKIARTANVEESAIMSQSDKVRLTVDASVLGELAALDEVRVIHPTTKPTLFNNKARKILQVESATANNLPLRGKGQIVCVADTGLDKGDAQNVHDAFSGRVKRLYAWGRRQNNKTDDPDGHGTHVCGSVLGSGQHISQGLIEGTAPEATLIMQSTLSAIDPQGNAQLGGIPNDLGLLFGQGYRAGARIHTNSWGVPLQADLQQIPYDGTAEGIDKFVWEQQDMTILFAAGNDGQDQDRDGKVNERSLGAEAAAKNCITVGASENDRPDLTSGRENLPYTYGAFWGRKFTKDPLKNDHQANNPEGLSAFSSRGPTAEGRLKPDIVAPGTAILSARSRAKAFVEDVDVFGKAGDVGYMYLSGTSMATPLVAGCCALLRESLFKGGYHDEDSSGQRNPTASLIKALLINGASPMKGQYMPAEISNEPNPHSGFGRVNVAESIIKPNDQYSGYQIGIVDERSEEPFKFSVAVPQGDSGLTFKVTLVYADQPGAALINDLNLVVVSGDTERHGNQNNATFQVGSTEGFDRNNNVEQVVWPNFTGSTLDVMVKPYRLLKDVRVACAWRLIRH